MQRIKNETPSQPCTELDPIVASRRGRGVGRWCGYAIALILVAGAPGCASYEARDLPEVQNLPNSRQYDGFSLGAEIPENAVELRSQFDRDLLKFDVVPVNVYLRSTATDADFSIDPATITLRYSDGTELEQISPAEAYLRCHFSHWRVLPWWLLFFPGAFVAHPVIAGANGSMEQDFNAKRLKPQKLVRDTSSARDGTVGVVFFAPPGDEELDYPKIQNGGELAADIVKYESDSPDAPKTLRILFGN